MWFCCCCCQQIPFTWWSEQIRNVSVILSSNICLFGVIHIWCGLGVNIRGNAANQTNPLAQATTNATISSFSYEFSKKSTFDIWFYNCWSKTSRKCRICWETHHVRPHFFRRLSNICHPRIDDFPLDKSIRQILAMKSQRSKQQTFNSNNSNNISTDAW